MILKASTRGNAVALGRHLTNERDNDHIELHEVRGFTADDAMGAMQELHAISKGVKSRQPLFSVSLSPPQNEKVDVAVFERAIDEIEARNGLMDQPRIVLFHEKEGRRHAHAVWSRIDAERMIAIPLPFYKTRLRDLSREIFLEQQWSIPPGLVDRTQRDPRNFDLAQYQQAKRDVVDPKRIRLLAQEAWAISDNRATFQQALEERGLYLGRGDRRSHVAMSWRGEIRSLPRLLGRKTHEVRERLGDAETLRGIEEMRAYIAEHVAPTLERVIGEADRRKAEQMQPLDRDRLAMRERHRLERQRMDAGLATREADETRERAARLRTGISGLLDRVSGRCRETLARNEREALAALRRDREQRQIMIDAQLAERRALQERILEVRRAHGDEVEQLHRDLAQQLDHDRSPHKAARERWLEDEQDAAREARRQWADEHRNVSAPDERKRWVIQQDNSREDRAEWVAEQSRDSTRERLAPGFNDRAREQREPQRDVAPRRDDSPDRNTGFEPQP